MLSPPLRLTPHLFLLPARSQEGLYILRLLIDALIPGEASLLREPRHRLDELIDLGAEQRLAIARLDRLDPVIGAEVPVLYRDLVA